MDRKKFVLFLADTYVKEGKGIKELVDILRNDKTPRDNRLAAKVALWQHGLGTSGHYIKCAKKNLETFIKRKDYWEG